VEIPTITWVSARIKPKLEYRKKQEQEEHEELPVSGHQWLKQ